MPKGIARRAIVASTPYRFLAGGICGTNLGGDAVHVDADELDAAMIQTRKLFETMLAKCVTTFYLAPKDNADPDTWNITDPGFDVQNALLAIASIPFPCLRIVQTVLTEDVGPVDSEVICYGDGVKFGWVARDHQQRTGVTAYSPADVERCPSLKNGLPLSYMGLMESLSNNSARYIERPVTRQVRRASGFAEGYREYIVIRQPSKEQRTTALRLAAIMRRHPRLHAVRGHLRHYRKTGLVVPVAAHARGGNKDTFELLQAKNYITEAQYYTEG